MGFETTSVTKLKEYAERMKSRMASVAKQAERSVDAALTVVEVGGTTFAFGYINGRYGAMPANATANALPEYDIAGVPADLAAGIVLVGVGLMGGAGKYEEHAVRVGAGAIGAWGYRTGFQMGATAYTNSSGANSRTTTVTSGMGGQMGAGGARVRTGQHQVRDLHGAR